MEDETPENLTSNFKTYVKFHNAHLVGILVRNIRLLARNGKNLATMQLFLKLAEAYEAYEQTGCILAIMKNINRATRKKVNQGIVLIKLLHIMKKLRPFKRKFLNMRRI